MAWREHTPSLAITTAVKDPLQEAGLADLRDALEQWIDRQQRRDWPVASHAAITLWLHARQRARRADVLAATQTRSEITVDGDPVDTTRLTTETGLWAASVDHGDLALGICAREIDPAALRLEPLADPSRLLGLEPPDA